MVTNREGAAKDQEFLQACQRTNAKPTIRQYSKWRNRRGTAYTAHNNIKQAIDKDSPSGI